MDRRLFCCKHKIAFMKNVEKILDWPTKVLWNWYGIIGIFDFTSYLTVISHWNWLRGGTHIKSIFWRYLPAIDPLTRQFAKLMIGEFLINKLKLVVCRGCLRPENAWGTPSALYPCHHSHLLCYSISCIWMFFFMDGIPLEKRSN